MSFDDISKYLEGCGWLRSVAGDADFNAAVRAIGQVLDTGKGLIVSGDYGCGKTSLVKALLTDSDCVSILLGVQGQNEKLTDEWWTAHATHPSDVNVFIDDLGAERQMSEYGVMFEPAGEFVMKWYEFWARQQPTDRHRLLITTNLSMEETDKRYGGRFVSRLKDLCVPLRLNGKDKRQWTK